MEKKKKKPWRYQHVTRVHKKLWLDDVRFLRYGARRTDGRMEKSDIKRWLPHLKNGWKNLKTRACETCRCWKEKLMKIQALDDKFNILAIKERKALTYSKNEKTIVIKGVSCCSGLKGLYYEGWKTTWWQLRFAKYWRVENEEVRSTL